MSDSNETDYISGAIAQAQAKIEELQTAIRTLESLRTLVGVGGGTAVTGGKVSFGHDAFFGMTAADAAKKYLSAIKKTATAKTIADALVAGGWKSASKNIPENIRTILSRNALFVVINGEFGLAEWYPGRKSGIRLRTAQPSQPLGDGSDNAPDLDAPDIEVADEEQ